MAMPAGAQRVTYTISGYTDDGEVDITLPAGLDPAQGDRIDAAMEAAANLLLSELSAAFPEASFGAGRRYDLTTPGEPWPAPAEEA
ncbi:hypothetical protein [Streptomyces hoynatensis]|uniref:Uncharacterized protein n=1 Tax=Streptomyces hoynatensis TaxID=1141874 RepID=A0A3A9YXR7_9ACTN|nr:hypothetical protein [Streptomyces hoynatensis]RKN40813.1 hypothetical protein D7294_17160 [Streptomyces hoynatensis]